MSKKTEEQLTLEEAHEVVNESGLSEAVSGISADHSSLECSESIEDIIANLRALQDRADEINSRTKEALQKLGADR